MTGVERFKEILDKYKDRKILIYGDPDVDGLFSLLFMCQFCDYLGLKYSYYVNSKRFHGLDLSAKDLKGYLVIASDFTITMDEMVDLVNNDVVVLSTDHHDVQKDFIDIKGATAEGIVINNQYPFEPEEDKYLSGAGVFYELVCSLYPDFKTKERDALVGITLLSDVRQIENPKARKYLKTTFSIDTSQGYINYLISSVLSNDFNFGKPRLDRNFIDYILSPTINALLRFDKTSEAVNFILGNGLTSTNYRDLQKDLIAKMKSRAYILKNDSLHILAVNELDFLEFNTDITSFIGLLCSNYKDSNNNVSTLGFVYENGKITRASFRGKYDDIPYRMGFFNQGLNAVGHQNAFGLKNFTPTDDICIQLNDLVREMELEHQETITVIECSNLACLLVKRGYDLASENCYVRDMYRSYIKYTGSNIKIVKTTYKTEEFTDEDYINRVKPYKTIKGKDYKLLLDKDGNPVIKYLEYLIDGRQVKSFGVLVEDGFILPVLEKGYINLYVRSLIS